MVTRQKQEDRLSVAAFRARFAEQIERCNAGRNIIITNHGKPRAVLMSFAEYNALAANTPEARLQNINMKEWEKGAKERREVADSIASLFDEKKLSRKGQKGYKQRAVKRIAKT